jgi:excisionase family DNA binding protein
VVENGKSEPPAVRGLSINDAAKYIGVSPVTIYRMARRNEISIKKISQRSIILRDDLDRLLGVTASREV